MKDVRKKKKKNEDFNVQPFGGMEVAKKKIKIKIKIGLTLIPCN